MMLCLGSEGRRKKRSEGKVGGEKKRGGVEVGISILGE